MRLILLSVILLLFNTSSAQTLNRELLYGKWQSCGIIIKGVKIDMDSIDETFASMVDYALTESPGYKLTATDTQAINTYINKEFAGFETATLWIHEDGMMEAVNYFRGKEDRDTTYFTWLSDSTLLVSGGKGEGDTLQIVSISEQRFVFSPPKVFNIGSDTQLIFRRRRK